MKTFVVLSALVVLAIAAPAQLEDGSKSKETEHTFPAHLNRDKKATQEDIAETSVTAPAQDEVEPTARTFGHKKPVIVKKKLGVHYYRDSAEERAQANSKELCTKEVKVKLCDSEKDGKTAEHLRATFTEDNNGHQPDSEVKESIKMAKEAVEHLQRDLHNMESGSAGRIAQWKHSGSPSDMEIHEDIEVARKALENIQNSFKSFESTNPESTSFKHSKISDELSFDATTTDSERMAQWKDAMNNIQRNIEIARNIEDSFKSVKDESSPALEESKPLTQAKQNEEIKIQEMKSSGIQAPASESLIKDKSAENAKEVMEVAASEVNMEVRANDNMMIHNMHTASLPMDGTNTQATKTFDKERSHMEDSSLLKERNEMPAQLGKNAASMNVNTESQNLETLVKSSNQENHNANFKSLEENNKQETSQTEKLLTEKLPEPKMAIEPMEKFEITETETQPKIAASLKSVDNIDLHLEEPKESSKQFDGMVNLKQKPIIDDSEKMRSAESEKLDVPITNPTMHTKVHLNQQIESQSAFQPQRAALENIPNIQEHNKQFNMELQKNHDSERTFHHGGLSHEHIGLIGHEHGHEHGHGHGHGHGSHHFSPVGHHYSPVGHHLSPIHHGHSIEHGFFRNVENKHNGKSADMEGAMTAAQPSMMMKEASEKTTIEHNDMMQWKNHDLARGAYGLGGYGAGAAGPGSVAGGLNYGAGGDAGLGTVGVFPKAVGNCAIPLLLSCSPSVVSGSLLKSQSYNAAAAPAAYRADNKFHGKRNTRKIKEQTSSKLNRKPLKQVKDKKNE